MDDDDDFYDEMSQDDYDEESDDCFDEPAVVQQDSLYKVLDEATCASLAQKQVVEVSEVLCCDIDVSQTLLRHFNWDREKLTEGAFPHSSSLVRVLPVSNSFFSGLLDPSG